MITLTTKSGRTFWLDKLEEKDGKYVFIYLRKDGEIEKHEIDKTEIVDKCETSESVKEYFEKREKDFAKK